MSSSSLLLIILTMLAPCRRSMLLRMKIRKRSSQSITFMQKTDAEDSYLGLLSKGSVSKYWIEQLKLLDRPIAVELIPKLSPKNVLGFEKEGVEAKKGTFLRFTIEQKEKHPDKVILIRNGEFYETFGVDALMLVNYCGLNPMASKPQAGCPMRNIQATLDGLTDAGLSVAVYEELTDTNADRGPSNQSSKTRIKQRFLSQVVSPGARTYAYDLCLRADNIDYRENQPVLALAGAAAGFIVCQVWLDERRVAVHERLTAEAVKMLLDEGGAVEPVFTAAGVGDLPFLTGLHSEVLEGGSGDSHALARQVLRRVSDLFEVNTAGFRIQADEQRARPRSLYTSTALQIGLLPNRNVPSLVSHLLPRTHAAASARWLLRWVSHPPPFAVADSMQRLCLCLSRLQVGLPALRPVPVGKVVSLLASRQCNAALFGELLLNARGVHSILSAIAAPAHPFAALVDALEPVLALETGLSVPRAELAAGCTRIIEQIDSVVAESAAEDKCSTDPSGCIPVVEFFSNNEEPFRGKVCPSQPDIAQLYEKVAAAAQSLSRTVHEQFPVSASIVYDYHNNALYVKERPNDSAAVYTAAVDRKGRVIPRRYTTSAVQAALTEYIAAVEEAPTVVTLALQVTLDVIKRVLTSLVQGIE